MAYRHAIRDCPHFPRATPGSAAATAPACAAAIEALIRG